MTKKECKIRIDQLLKAGTPKSQVYQELRGQGVSDKLVATLIAHHADPILYETHDKKVNALVTIMFVQSAFAFVIGYFFGKAMGPTTAWWIAIIGAIIPLLFAFGFYKNHAGTYNAYIILTIVQFPKALGGFLDQPLGTFIGFLIGGSLLAYVWYVRNKLFPDFAFITPKKLNGEFVFKS